MRNLTLQSFSQLSCGEIKIGDAFCCSSQLNDIYICSKGYVYCKSSGNQNFSLLVDLHDYYHDTAVPKTVNLVLNCITDSLNLSFENGDILSIEQGSSEITCVGCVESGIRAMCWSPDQEVVSVVTGNDTVLMVAGAFDPINEVELHQEGFGEKQFITVGWGKKETQFHGSEGKAARVVTGHVEKKQNNDTGIPCVSWRGDGVLFAVSSVGPKDIRYIRIFSREGILQYTSEPTSGLGSVLAWRPSGNVLATTQCLPNKYVVTFFEKNGLKHGEFVLPFDFSEVRVTQLLWNSDSSILTSVGVNIQLHKTFLYFWTVNNYHWYLKQVLEFPAEKKLLHVEWDSLHRYRLHVFREGGSIIYTCYDWTWIVNSKSNATEEDGAVVVVIDGADVLLTSFHQAVVPPPMCSQKLTLRAPVNAVAFPAGRGEGLCTVLSDGSVAALSPQGDTLWHSDVSWGDDSPGGLPPHHWLWLAADTFLCCHNSCLAFLTRDCEQNKLVVRSSTPVDGTVSGLCAVPGGSLVLVQLSDGSLLTYDPSGAELGRHSFALPERCAKLDVCRVDGSQAVFALSDRNRFYVDGKEVASNVTSYALHPHFLLLTTLQHTLLCCRLGAVRGLAAAAGTARRVERGARLVAAVPGDTRAVLQSRRGNLECVQPRPMVLHAAACLLDARSYRAAFLLARRQRLNLNLLCDHDRDAFLGSAARFAADVADPGWLSLFLSELREEDVTRTTYAGFYPDRTGAQPPSQSRSKVEVVCEALREALLARADADAYLLPVLTSHVRQGSAQDLAAALLRIKAVKQACAEEGGSKLAVSAADALKHILYLVDVNELYDVALGMYDFDLVQLVAARSQKDPKEYLPFLNHLLSLEPDYRKYCINKHLQRYEEALKHIVRCLDDDAHFQECLDLVKEHRLYTHALELLGRDSRQYRRVAVLYAEHLREARRWDEAAVMFRRGGDPARALDCCAAAGDWRQAVLLAGEMDYSASQLRELCQGLVGSLCERRQHGDAAEILAELLGHTEESVAMLARGCLWPRAVWAALRAGRPDLLETHIKPGLLEHQKQMLSQLETSRELFSRHKTRLAVVRKMQKLQLQDETEPAHPDCDLFSDTSTIMGSSAASSRSRSSTRTFRSSKSRRKQERKLLSLKEGSQFEDLALIRSLHELVTSAVKAKSEVRGLCQQLVHFEYDQQASDLQQALESLLQEMQQSLADIWSPEVTNIDHSTYGPEETVNSLTSKLKLGGEIPGVSYTLLEPSLRIPPNLNDDKTWKFDIFKSV
ncbi:elongator complex protein 1 [Bacillus rossius redtenbacheri]|uniref:elongator complex protein 1 n=1 Tax=Bacillus rossius redtenbacheri TaxID=93214 RepID=UPI002FDDAD12